MTAPLYTKDILRLAASLEAAHDLARTDGRAELRAPTCGSTIATAVMLGDDGRVVDLSQRVSACAFGQASAALAAQHAKGRSLDEIEQALADLAEWLSGRRDDPGGWPGFDALAPARSKTGRHGAILLPFRAIAAAIQGTAR